MPIITLSNAIENPAALAQLTQLSELNLSGNNISDASALTTLTKLTNLQLSNNALLSTINSGVTALGYAATLEQLNLSSSNFSTLPDFSDFTALKGLHINNSNLASLAGFSEIATLVKLEFISNSLTSVSPLHTWTTLPLELNLSGNPAIDCDASTTALIEKAQTDAITLVMDDCVVVEIPTIATTVEFMDIARLSMFEIQKTEGFGANGKTTGREFTIGATTWKENTHCLFKGTMAQPICWTSPNGDGMACSGTQGETIYTCQVNAQLQEYYPTLTVDTLFGRQLNGKFVSAFTGRNILNLLSIDGTSFNPIEVTMSCTALAVDAEHNGIETSTCTLTSPLVNGPAISWKQTHTHKVMPQCSGAADGHIAKCTPLAASPENDPVPGTVNDFSFDLDLSSFSFIDRVTGVEECDPEQGLCDGQ